MKTVPIPEPYELVELASEAARVGVPVSLAADRVRALAECWHADREKIRYLENLIVRCCRNSGEIHVQKRSGRKLLSRLPASARAAARAEFFGFVRENWRGLVTAMFIGGGIGVLGAVVGLAIVNVAGGR